MHIRYLECNPGKKIVSQPCAAIINYVEKHRPEMIPHMSPVHSPLMCSAVYIRKYLKNDDILVGLTPCLAKGDEFRNTGIVGYNVCRGTQRFDGIYEQARHSASHGIQPL